MGHGANSVYRVTIASGTTLSAELDFGRIFTTVYIDPTGAASEVRLQASTVAGGTYRQVYQPLINSSTVAANIYKIPSSVSGGFIPIPPGIRFLKVETTAAVANGLTFNLIASDS